MAKIGNWSAEVTPEIQSNMANTARYAYENGRSLREDALALFEMNRYSRAVALAILAEEEFSKSFMLTICIQDNRWDSNILKALLRHNDKQGLSAAMTEYASWFVNNYKKLIESGQVPNEPTKEFFHPGKDKIDKILNIFKDTANRKDKDTLKQEALYVGIDKSAKVSSHPWSLGQQDAQKCLDETLVFQVITEILNGNHKNINVLEGLLESA